MTAPYVILLGTAQDGGYPHVGCNATCCEPAWNDPTLRRRVACFGIVDPATKSCWMIDCTPDFPSQLRILNEIGGTLAGIFLTHAHIGHYTGLINFGREAMNADRFPAYAMPRMRAFLEANQPWCDLIRNDNIVFHSLTNGEPVKLNDRITIEPFLVPHRDEHSETVGYRITGPNRSVAYIPDIDGWPHDGFDLPALLDGVDIALLDGTFFDANEIPNRNVVEIPHPTIRETMQRLEPLPPTERAKVRFTHFNHTNPVLRRDSAESKAVVDAGLQIANDGDCIAI